MSLGIELLLCDEPAAARGMAEALEQINAERRAVQQVMTDEAEHAVARASRAAEGELPARAVPVRCGLAPRRGRAGGFEDQGAPAPADGGVCPGRSGRGASGPARCVVRPALSPVSTCAMHWPRSMPPTRA
jgi:hypothetical protein